ncbi:TetR family transcriptional regulator [Nocardia sp. BMG111209]|uniref:TetR family transcriptional regulator n=1 Tax=Nocardia sp. BMG111209 TaxID=1160137 RepID=UPI00037BF6C6|nr:TetR family transcriptional regulator [Nocardia sp. BMG111209]
MDPDDRSLPLRERKRLRTRRSLADTALRLFAERGFDATTVDELVDAAEVSRSTFFRTFATKEAAAVEAETELWAAYLAAVPSRARAGTVLDALRDSLIAAVDGLPGDWDARYVATRRLILTTPGLLGYVEYHRTGVERDVIGALATELGLDADDLRLRILAELATTAWSIAGRDWVRADGAGGRPGLADRLRAAFAAIPLSLGLAAGSR